MALEYKDRVKDQTATAGTGPFELALTAPTGFRSFAVFTDGATVRYSVAGSDLSEWEVGEGVWNAATSTLSRDTIYGSSNAGAAVDFSAGTKTVTVGPQAQDLIDAVTKTGTETLSNKTLVNPTAAFQTLTDGSTINWDLDGGQLAYLTLGGFTRSMAAPTHMKAGGSYFLFVTQDSTGGRTIVWDSAFRWGSGSAPTLTSTPGRTDVLHFISDGSFMYGMPFAFNTSANVAAPPPPPADALAMGYNLSGMEWYIARTSASSRLNMNWVPPRPGDIQTIKSWGLPNLVNRLPISWELLQPVLLGSPANSTVLAAEGVTAAGALHPGYVSYIRQVLDQHATAGAKVIIDLHNYARYRDYIYQGDGSVSGYQPGDDLYTRPYSNTNQVVERICNTVVDGDEFNGTTLTQAQLNDVWTKLATEFRDHAGLGGYGIMNEPHDMPSVSVGASSATFSQPAGSISIASHGAVAGGPNCRSAIHAAIAAAKAAGVDVWVPPGVWHWTGGVLNVDSVHLIGAGYTQSTLFCDDVLDCSCFLLGDGAGVEQLKLTNNTTTRVPNWERTKVFIGGPVTNWTVKNCWIENSPAASIHADNPGSGSPSGGYIGFNTIVNSMSDSIHLTGATSDVLVEFNDISSSGDDGVACASYTGYGTPVKFVTARHNVIKDNDWGRGMSVLGGEDIYYYNNYIEGNASGFAGMYIAAENNASWQFFAAKRVKFELNTIVDCGSNSTGHGAITCYSDGLFTNDDIWFLRNDIVFNTDTTRRGHWLFGPQTNVKLEQYRYNGTGPAVANTGGGTNITLNQSYTSGDIGYTDTTSDLSIWNEFAKSAVDAIRLVDTETPIYVSGNNWSSAIDFEANNPGYPLKDGSGVLYPNIVYEGHVYLDASSSGQRFDYDNEATFGFSAGEPGEFGISEQTMLNRLVEFVGWCNTNGVQGAVTETGMPTNDGNNADDRWAKMYKAGIDFLQANNIQLMNWMHSSLWVAQNWPVNATINWHDNKPVEPAVSGLMKNTQAVDQCQFFASADKAWGIAGTALTIRVWGRGNLTTPRTFAVTADNGTLSTSSITLQAGHNPRATFTFTTASERTATISFTGTGAPASLQVFSQSSPAGIASLAGAASALCAKYDAAKWEMRHAFTDYNVGGIACQAGSTLRAVRDSGYATKQNNIYDMKSWWHNELPDVDKHGNNPDYAPPKAALLAGRIVFDGSSIASTSGLWCKKRVPMASATKSLNSDPSPQDKALFNLHDSFFVVAAFRTLTVAPTDGIIFAAAQSEDTHYVSMGFNGSAQARMRWVDTAGGTQQIVGSTLSASANHTMSMRFAPGSQVFRVDGVQVGTLSSAIAANSNFDVMLIGANFYNFFLRDAGFNGYIIGVIAGKGNPTTTELAAMENYLLSLGS